MRLFFTELKKLRRRHIGLIYGVAFLVTFIWLFWAMDRTGSKDDLILRQGYYYLLINLPLINSIFLPITLACAESRICDIELKGNTFKLLCTMQPRHSIYHVKLALSALYLLGFSLAETAIIPILGRYYQVQQPMPVAHIGIFCFTTFTVSLVLSILQQSLSLLSENQLFPLFLGVGGTFVGVFTGFFPDLPVFYFLPWGYYFAGSTVNMFYESATRTVTYYEVPFRKEIFLGFIIFGILVYLTGKSKFMKKEV